MSKIQLKRIVLQNKRNSSRIISKDNIPLKTFRTQNVNGNYSYNISDKKHIKLSNKNELNYDLENKENYFLENIKDNDKNKSKENNLYLSIKKNNNEFNKTIKNNTNKNLKNSKIFYMKKNQNKNSVFNLLNSNRNNNYNNYNNEIYRNNKISDNFIKAYADNKNYYTYNLVPNMINKHILHKSNTYNLFDVKKRKEKEKQQKINKSNHKCNLSLKRNYLLPNNYSDKKTLILDLDETLIHSSNLPFKIKDDITIKIKSLNNNIQNNNNQYVIHVLKRPFVGIFLSIVCEIFEVVVFTAGIPEYANPILNEIDSEKKIKYRLFRDHCVKIDKDKYIKNLNYLGRDLRNVIIIDNNPISYTLNIDNGLPISSWETDQKDNELIKLIPLLQFLSKKNISDVRPIINRIVNNNFINYDEVNKIINNKNSTIYLYEKDNINNSNDKIHFDSNLGRVIQNKYMIKSSNKSNKKTFNLMKQKYNININNNYLNNCINNNKKLLKNFLFKKKEYESLIKKKKSLSSNYTRTNSEKRYYNKISFYDEKEQKNNTVINKNFNFNLPESYLIMKKNNDNYTNYIKMKINYNENKQNIYRINKKENKIPTPNYFKYLNYKDRKSIKDTNKSNYLKDNSNNLLINNYSDYRFNINRNILNDKNKIPKIKKLLYHKLLKNDIYKLEDNNNNKNNITLFFNNTNKSKNKYQVNKNLQKLLFLKKNDKSLRENNFKSNYSLENYLNNRLKLNILDNNLNNYINNLKIKNSKKLLSELKGVVLSKTNRTLRENNSMFMNRYINNFDINKTLRESYSEREIKHNITFFNDRKRTKDNIDIFNGYKI